MKLKPENKKTSGDDESTRLKLKNEVAHPFNSINKISDEYKITFESNISLNECQFCNTSKKNQEILRKYEEKCLNCAKILCEKCSILSSINVNNVTQKICLLCKKCSKIENLNIELSESNTKDIKTHVLLEKNENSCNISLNEEILTIDLKNSQVILII